MRASKHGDIHGARKPFCPGMARLILFGRKRPVFDLFFNTSKVVTSQSSTAYALGAPATDHIDGAFYGRACEILVRFGLSAIAR